MSPIRDGVEQHNPPAHGAFGGSLAQNTAAGISWRTGEPGRRGWTITYLPGCPQDFLEEGWQLSAEGYNNILDTAVNFQLSLSTLPSYPPNTLVLGTVHRSRHGAPLPASVFAPFVDWFPVSKIVTIRRRIPESRSVLPF